MSLSAPASRIGRPAASRSASPRKRHQSDRRRSASRCGSAYPGDRWFSRCARILPITRAAIVRMHDVLEGDERVGKVRVRVTDDLAEARRIPDVAGEQIPVVQAIRRAAHRALPALLDFERVALICVCCARCRAGRRPRAAPCRRRRDARPWRGRETISARRLCVGSAILASKLRRRAVKVLLEACRARADRRRQHQTLAQIFARQQLARIDAERRSATDRCSRPRRARRSSPTSTARSLRSRARAAPRWRAAIRARACTSEMSSRVTMSCECDAAPIGTGWRDAGPQRRAVARDGRSIRRVQDCSWRRAPRAGAARRRGSLSRACSTMQARVRELAAHA